MDAGVKSGPLKRRGTTLDELAKKVGTVERVESYRYMVELRSAKNPAALMVTMIEDCDEPETTPAQREALLEVQRAQGQEEEELRMVEEDAEAIRDGRVVQVGSTPDLGQADKG